VTNTPFGRYLYAIGGNEEAAAVSGVPVRTTIIGAYALMGGIVALTGFMQTAYSGASTSTVGSLMELDAVAACVIGGTSLSGGIGTIWGTIVGALIIGVLLATAQAFFGLAGAHFGNRRWMAAARGRCRAVMTAEPATTSFWPGMETITSPTPVVGRIPSTAAAGATSSSPVVRAP
jgi:branched-subunit amino acid ABC-type transport system permease component